MPSSVPAARKDCVTISLLGRKRTSPPTSADRTLEGFVVVFPLQLKIHRPSFSSGTHHLRPPGQHRDAILNRHQDLADVDAFGKVFQGTLDFQTALRA